MPRLTASKILKDIYQFAYCVLGLQGAFLLINFWGWAAWLVGLLLGFVLVVYSGVKAARQPEGYLWLGTAYSTLLMMVDLPSALGLFYGCWRFLHWHWFAATLLAATAFAVMQWLRSLGSEAGRPSVVESQG